MSHKSLWDFEIKTDQLIPTKNNLVLINKKKITYRQVDFAVQADNRFRLKENEQ